MIFRPKRKRNLSEWHNFFAWMPTHIGAGAVAWLHWIQRRQFEPKAEGVIGPCFEYREDPSDFHQ